MEPMEATTRRSPIPLILGAVVVLALVAGGWYFYSYNYGVTCGVKRVEASLGDLEQIAEEWDDAVSLAGSTSRIALSGPIGDLQDIRRDLMRLRVPACLVDAQIHLTRTMDNTIEAFLAFASQRPDSEVSEYLSRAGFSQESFRLEIERVSKCVPDCD
ncbi:MAG: hypothetical protein HYZ26_00805 [Chloroflexi bacterium]|nr:hypothetical protein [Chloroflexota bacterium]